MAVLSLIKVGDRNDAILYKPVTRVRDFGPKLHKLLDDMLETMRAAPGTGLAAPQVGVELRALVIDCPEDPEKPDENVQTYELINPEILKAKGKEEEQEGCLSLPGLVADVDRATQVLVRAQDRHGREFRLKAYDWLARIVQHEIDHLQGVLMTDRCSQLYKVVEKGKNEKGEMEYEAIPIENILPGRKASK